MRREPESELGKRAGWAEHTVVANLPRLLPAAAREHAPLAHVEEPRTLIGMPPPRLPPQPSALGRPLDETEEPRTVVGEAPSRAVAQQLIARYAALSAPPVAPPAEPTSHPSEPRAPWFRRTASFVREDFRKAPRIVRLLVPALPLIVAATTFLDVDPRAAELSRAVAVAATASVADPEPPAAPDAKPALPSSSVTIVPHSGRTLAAEAADAAARGDRQRAIAAYAQLARDNPENPVFASAARILMRDKARDRPAAER